MPDDKKYFKEGFVWATVLWDTVHLEAEGTVAGTRGSCSYCTGHLEAGSDDGCFSAPFLLFIPNKRMVLFP